jgi:Protein of unknown function (DUF3987)
MRDELVGFLGAVSGRYSSDADVVRSFWNTVFEAGFVIRDRVKFGEHIPPVIVPRAACSIIGGIQPGRLRDYLREIDDGFMARFFYIWPRKERTRDLDWRARRVGTADVFKRVFRTLYDLPLDVDGKGTPHPVALPLAVAAQGLFNDINKDCGDRADGEREILAQYLSKGGGRILRLALVFELMAWALAGEDLPPSEVGLDALERAIRYYHYTEAMLRRTLANLEPTQSTNDAHAIVKCIGERGWREFTNYQLSRQPGFFWFRAESPETKNRRVNALSLLTENNVIRRVSISVKRGDGWEIHPKLGEKADD